MSGGRKSWSVYWRGTVKWLCFSARPQPPKEVPRQHGISKQERAPKMSLHFRGCGGHRTCGGFACRAISRSKTVPEANSAKATAKRCMHQSPNEAVRNRKTNRMSNFAQFGSTNVPQRFHCEVPADKHTFHWKDSGQNDRSSVTPQHSPLAASYPHSCSPPKL